MAKKTDSIIAYTLVIPELKEYLDKRAALEQVTAIDLLSPLLNAFMEKFHKEPKHTPKLMRKMDEQYYKRIEAIEFAVKYDDGRDPRGVLLSDIVLIGVSRTSKTPLAMYLANQGYKVANVPLIPEVAVPEELFQVPRKKCFGLIISPEKLIEIRRERLKSMGLRAQSTYASYERIFEELEYAEKIFKRLGCPVIDVSHKAIEETANVVIQIFSRR